jgi:rSAM/selenodomain-associated transferase 1
MKEALIIFVRSPLLGKVKTRLAAAVGEVKALEIYCQLLSHTHIVTCSLNCAKFVFYADVIKHNDLWEEDVYQKVLQEGNDLGERMKNAFEHVFDSGYNSICIIGSDCMTLNAEGIQSAFTLLADNDLVIGPTVDGGYYLLGMKQLIQNVFANKSWSTESVLQETLSDIASLQLACRLLAVLHDIDTEQDWLYYQSNLRHSSKSTAS